MVIVTHLEVLRVPANLVDVGQRAAVVGTLTPDETELLGLKLTGQRQRQQEEEKMSTDRRLRSKSVL